MLTGQEVHLLQAPMSVDRGDWRTKMAHDLRIGTESVAERRLRFFAGRYIAGFPCFPSLL